jgi:hypothetical protein
MSPRVLLLPWWWQLPRTRTQVPHAHVLWPYALFTFPTGKIEVALFVRKTLGSAAALALPC